MYAISGTVFASIIILAGPLSGGHFNPAVTLGILVRESVETGSSFARTGCKIVYCDIDEENLMPSFDQIKKLVTKKTRAIVIVHYQGFSVDYLDKLQEFCRKKNIFLVEDAAQAMGSYFKDKPLGSYGDFGCISFHHTKNIHSGIGGLLILNNKKLKKKIDFIYDKGTDRSLVISKKRKYY